VNSHIDLTSFPLEQQQQQQQQRLTLAFWLTISPHIPAFPVTLPISASFGSLWELNFFSAIQYLLFCTSMRTGDFSQTEFRMRKSNSPDSSERSSPTISRKQPLAFPSSQPRSKTSQNQGIIDHKTNRKQNGKTEREKEEKEKRKREKRKKKRREKERERNNAKAID
jgi:hypothetical protein